MNAVEFLKAHHRQVERTFARLETAQNEQKTRLFERLADALATHAQLEHRLYAAVAAKSDDETLLDQHGSHAGIVRVMADLLQESTDDENFGTRMTILREIVRRHIRKDEADFFPQVKKLLSDGELQALGHEMESELIRLYDRGIPRRLFEKQKALVPGERTDGEQTEGLRAGAFQ